MNWPAYFQPTSTNTEATPEGQPICLLDAFYLANPNCAPELFAVVGLESGGLRAIRAHEVQMLPDALQRQLRAALVSKRGALRTLQASQLFLFTLDSIEQREMSGLNDAVLLFGRAQASLDCLVSSWEVTPLNQLGSLTVGQLDVLHGYTLGFAHVWRNPEAPSEFVSHLFVPAGLLAEVQGGCSLALAYPLFDVDTTSALHRTDNTSLVLRLVYDVLLKLQQDLVRSGNTQPFAKVMLPVPSRQRLEYELVAEGYEIRGHEAVRVGKAQPNQRNDLLERLRRWAVGWSAPRIALPPQAKPRIYHDLVTRALGLAANEHDKAMMMAMKMAIKQPSPSKPATARTSKSQLQPHPQKRKTKAPQPLPRSDAPAYEVTPRLDEALAQPLPPAQPTPQMRTPKSDDWSKDFGKPVAPKPAQAKPDDWVSDFDSGSDVSEESGSIANNEQDFVDNGLE